MLNTAALVRQLDKVRARVEELRGDLTKSRLASVEKALQELERIVAKVDEPEPEPEPEEPVDPPLPEEEGEDDEEPPIEEPEEPEVPDEPEEPAPLPEAWWRQRFVEDKAPRSRRGWNVGTFAVMGSDLNQYRNYMGYHPEIVGGNCTGYGSGKWLADTWGQVVSKQTAVAAHPQTADWLHSPDDTWLAWMFTTLPFGCRIDEMHLVADGKRRDKHKYMGANLRKNVLAAKRKLEMVIGRPNWEGQNSDTALRIKAPGRIQNYLLAGGTVELYNQHMLEFVAAFWEGYEHRLPMALSPAWQDAVGVPHKPYEAYVVPEVYDLLCGSFHPTPQRCQSEQAARDMVWSTKLGRYTPGVVLAASRKFGLPMAFLEHSCPDYAKGDRRFLHVAYREFGRLLNENADRVAFSCCLGTQMINERRVADPHWAPMVRAHRECFGRAD